MRKVFRITAIFTMFTIVALSFSSCATFDAFKGEFFPEEQNVNETIKIGVFQPLTGENKSEGELEVKGIELAHELYPKCLGKNVELVYTDNRSDINAADEAIKELINEKPSVILGSYGSAYSLVASEHIKKAKIPTISITNSNPLVTRGNPYYFRVWFDDVYQGAILSKYAFEVLGVTEAAVMRKKNDDSSIPIGQSFEQKFIQMTGNQNAIPYTIEYKDDLSNVEGKLKTLKKAGIKTVFLSAEPASAVKILKIAEKMKGNFTFLGTEAWESDTFISESGIAARQVAISTIYDADAGINEMSGKFLQAYKDKYGKDAVPEPAVALAFDAYMIALEAMNKAGTSTDGTAIMESLQDISKFEGASGNITFDSNGDAMKTVIIKGVKDREFTNVYTMEPNVV
ncbi:MAG: ABC transporter substrate-binding protein [Eubacteriales bacterium]|nr:ABC transporter substrate-binding protein [Eubacteriales bacterium]MDD4390885.1 ABC transporter substrate-binding protein [Eubacteriales bacterium]